MNKKTKDVSVNSSQEWYWHKDRSVQRIQSSITNKNKNTNNKQKQLFHTY